MDNINYDEILKEIDKQEKELQFTEFTNDTALRIGLILAERAKTENKSITIDINKSGHQLFHYSCPGTTPDNDNWIMRKCRVVRHFNKSSYYFATFFAKTGRTFEHYGLSSLDYAASGGAFPLIIKNVGVVGTIAVSGMAQEMDHQWVADAIREVISM